MAGAFIDIYTTSEGIKNANEYLNDKNICNDCYKFILENNLSQLSFEEYFGTILLTDEVYQNNLQSDDSKAIFNLLDLTHQNNNQKIISEVSQPDEESLFQEIKGIKYIVGTTILSKILNMSLVYPDSLSLFSFSYDLFLWIIR